MNQIKVTVSITTYNHEKFIAQAIESVLMQKTDFPFEILLGEDESTDATREICIEYANKYPDIIRLYLNSRENVIYIKGRPTGRWNLLNNIKNARGEYIALLDGDDYWTSPDKLQKQVDFLKKNPDFIMCCHNSKIINENDPSIIKYFRPDKVDISKDIMSIEDQISSVYSYPTSSVIFRNGVLKLPAFFSEIESADIALFTMLAQFGKIMYFDEVMSVYRKHDNGISQYHINDDLCLGRLKMNAYLNSYFNGKYEYLYREVNENLYKQLLNFYLQESKINLLIKHSLFYLHSYRASSNNIILKFSIVIKLFLIYIYRSFRNLFKY